MGKPKRFNPYDSAVAESRKATQSYGQARQDKAFSGGSFRSMPLQPPTINAGIFGLRGDGTGEYLTVSLAADQTANIAATNHVEFDTKDEDGGIELQTGVGQADGIFELLSGRKYIISAQLRPEFSGATGQLVVAWYDRTNSAELGSRGIYESQTHASDNANQPIADIIVNPTTNIDVEVRIIAVTALTALANEYCTASLFEISLGGFGASAGGGGGGSGVTFPLTPDVNTIGSVSGAQTINLALSDSHYSTITLTGDVTFTFSNPPASGKEMSFVIDILQDGTGGHSITWPGAVRSDPKVGSGANARTVVVGSTVDNGTTYDVLIVTGGTQTQGATRELDNLSTVAINTNLLSDTDNTDNLGSAAKEWKDLYIDGVAHIDTVDVDELLQITDTSTDPVANGDIRRNGTNVKVFSGGSVRNMSDIAVGANQQLSNLSGTVSVNLDLIPDQATGGNLGSSSSTEEWFNVFTRRVTFPVSTTLGASDYSFGKVSTPLRVEYNVPTGAVHRFTINGTRELELTNTELICAGVNIDMENNNITDTHQLQLTGSSGDTVLGLFTSGGSTLDISAENTDGKIRFFVDDSLDASTQIMQLESNGTASNVITFNKDGSAFAILDEVGAINFAVASGSKPFILGVTNGFTMGIQSGGVFDVDVDGVTKMTIKGADIEFFDNVKFGSLDLLDVSAVTFLDVNTTISDTSPGLQYDVPTLESHRFRVDNATIFDVNLNGIDLATGATVDFSQTGSASSGSGGTLPANVEGFIIVRVAGTLRRVPFYPV